MTEARKLYRPSDVWDRVSREAVRLDVMLGGKPNLSEMIGRMVDFYFAAEHPESLSELAWSDANTTKKKIRAAFTLGGGLNAAASHLGVTVRDLSRAAGIVGLADELAKASGSGHVSNGSASLAAIGRASGVSRQAVFLRKKKGAPLAGPATKKGKASS